MVSLFEVLHGIVSARTRTRVYALVCGEVRYAIDCGLLFMCANFAKHREHQDPYISLCIGVWGSPVSHRLRRALHVCQFCKAS